MKLHNPVKSLWHLTELKHDWLKSCLPININTYLKRYFFILILFFIRFTHLLWKKINEKGSAKTCTATCTAAASLPPRTWGPRSCCSTSTGRRPSQRRGRCWSASLTWETLRSVSVLVLVGRIDWWDIYEWILCHFLHWPVICEVFNDRDKF